MRLNLFCRKPEDEFPLDVPKDGGFMNQTKFFPPYEWTPNEDKESLQGNVKFIIGGMFSREIHLGSVDDCMYIADLIELAYKTGYMNGKDKIKHQLANILSAKD